MSQTQSIKPDTGRPPVSDAVTECEQTRHSKRGPGQSKRGLQATLSQSFQPDTPEHPNNDLLHSLSATSMRSTGSGIEPQTSSSANIQDAATEGAKAPDDMLPEHSLAAQMSSEAPASSLQQSSQPAANTEVEELADDMEAIDMLPEHSLVAQMSIDEPQPDAGEEDSVASRTTQLPHVLTTIESGLSAHFSGGLTPPGVSPFSMAPFPLSRAGSEALPPQPPSPESRKRHRSKVEEPLLRALSRLEHAISDWARDAHFDLPAPMAQALSSSLSSVSEESSEQEEGVTSAEPMEEDPQLLKLAATILSRSSSLYPGLESSFMPPSSGPAGHSSSSQAPPPAQVIGKAILAAASAHDQASDSAGGSEGGAAQKLGEAALSTAAAAAAAATQADQTAGREAAPVSKSPAPPASAAARSPLSKVITARSDDRGDPQHEAGAAGSPHHPSPAGAKQAGRGGHADKMLKAHSRDLGQRQQLVHAKLHQGHPPTKSAEAVSGRSFMDLKAEPAVADTDGFTKQAAAGSLSSKGGQGGLREAVSPTRDHMAQALRRRMS
ncbi:hypothetical protein WJX82_010459 [Trebouxia sp. C0006]